MNDDVILQSIAISGRRAPNGDDERRQNLRLIDEGYLRRIPVKPRDGDTNDALVCELTMLGRPKIGL